MSSKKSGKSNGFMKFCFHQQKSNSFLAGLSIPELVTRCSPAWETLSPEERNQFRENVPVKVSLDPLFESNNKYVGGFDSYGRPLADRVRHEKEKEQRKIKMRLDIKKMIDVAHDRGILEDKQFLLISTSHFCITRDGKIVPAELCLLKFSLRDGIVDKYLKFIEPGAVPMGYLNDCVSFSKATHKIPLDFTGFDGDYQKILQEMVGFMESGTEAGETPVLFCTEKSFKNTSMIIKWLVERAKSSSFTQEYFKLLSLSVLMFELGEDRSPGVESALDAMKYLNISISSLNSSSASSSVVMNRCPTLTVAEAHLEKEKFILMPDMSCKFHQEVECYNYCCEAVVKNWAYTVLSLIAPLLSIPMTVPEHIPVGLSGSSTLEYLSTAGTLSSVRSSSIVSGDTDSVKSASFAASFPSSQLKKYSAPDISMNENRKTVRERMEEMFGRKQGSKTSADIFSASDSSFN